MKKLFTMIALLSVFLGAKAEWVEDYNLDYSTKTGFPFYVMGYVPEWVDGVMTDYGAMFKYVEVKDDAEETSDVIVTTQNGVQYYKIALTEAGWHQYFIADGIPTEIDGSYTVKAMVKASEAVNINVNMGWGWGDGQQVGTSVAIGTEWAEVEWSYSGIGGTSCNLVAQPGTATATIEWKWVTVGHNAKPSRPTEWIENITNGDAEKSWADLGLADVKFNDMDNNYKICAWGKEREVNMNEEGGWDPFPATIEKDADGNHYFIVHGKAATTEGDAAAWDNQFWIQSPQGWKAGTTLRISFKYKASKAVTVATQVHNQQPSNYLIWHAIGDINFTEDWQEFSKDVTWESDMDGGWSVAFQLNQNDKDPIDFYFDDLSWKNMKLDEGYFAAGANPDKGIDYDLDNAVEFAEDAEAGCLTAVVGEKGAYIKQVMISTVRGNDAAFKSNTLKPAGTITDDPDNWLDYTPSSLAKLNLPGEGIWKIYLDTDYNAMAFEMLEGTEIKPIEINPNPSVVIVNAVERDWLTADNDGNPREAEIGTGEAWDNQFWIVANRELEAGETTVIAFDYVASKEAKSTTQCHAAPGGYIHWAAIGDINFTTEEQHFEKTFVIPNECAGKGMKSIAFNLAEIKDACDYTFKNFVWKLDDNTESLINQTGTANFWMKIGAGTEPYMGIKDIVNNNNTSAVTYNIAGQRVSKDYKGLVIKNGKKYVVK